MAPFDHAPGIFAATARASRERLLRFLTACAPSHPYWPDARLAAATDLPTWCLRDAAAVVAMHWWEARRTNRFWCEWRSRHGTSTATAEPLPLAAE